VSGVSFVAAWWSVLGSGCTEVGCMAGGGVGVAVGDVVECGIGGSGVPCSELQSTTGEFVNSRHCHPSWGDSFISGANSCASHAYSLVLTA